MEPQSPQVQKSASSNKIRTTLTVLNLFSLMPWLLALFVSFFAFGAPGSENNKTIWLMVILIWSYPITVFLSIFVAKLLYQKEKIRAALIVQMIPLSGAILYFMTFIGIDAVLSSK